MATLTQKAFDRKSMPEYPFDIGTRWVKDGSVDVQIPLTEDDFLHPEEEDQFLSTQAHTSSVTYGRNGAKSRSKTSSGAMLDEGKKALFKKSGILREWRGRKRGRGRARGQLP